MQNKEDDALGYTEEQVKQILFEDFRTWMIGQTVAIGSDSKIRYYPWDLDRFRARRPSID